MAKTFELIAIGMSVRNADGTTYEQPPGFEIPTEEGEEALDKVLKPFEQSSFLFMFRLETTLRKRPEGLPWCIVVFDREYSLAGHFCQYGIISRTCNSQRTPFPTTTIPLVTA